MDKIKKYYKEILTAPFVAAVLYLSLDTAQKNYILYVKKSLFHQPDKRLEFIKGIQPFKVENILGEVFGLPGFVFLFAYFFIFLIFSAVNSSHKIFLAKDKNEKNRLFAKFVTALGTILGSVSMVFWRITVCRADYSPNDCTFPTWGAILLFWGSLIGYLCVLNLESKKHDQN